MKLKKSLKTKWVKALRSGKYKQTQGTLYNPDTKSFCCLGVLEHIVLKGSVESKIEAFGGCSVFLIDPSPTFWESIGVDATESCASISTLIDMNDGDSRDEPASFKEIADWIDKHVEGV